MPEFLKLKSLSIRGYKSIKVLDCFEPAALNVFIGANGSGKSNFISFFRMLSWMMQSPGSLQTFVSQNGRASSFLHDGPQITPHLDGCIALETNQGLNEYVFQLTYAAGDTLIFTDEKYRFSSKAFSEKRKWTTLTPMGHFESRLAEKADSGEPTVKTIRGLLRSCVVYQFHNTSFSSRIRGSWAVTDNRWLKEDGANIAPFLLRLHDTKPEYYKRIVEFIRLSVPFFADFVLDATNGRLLMQWREVGSDAIFDASSASDGMLRYIALVSLLAQPPDELPDIMILDEPELGLHPYAINVIAGLLKAASKRIQILIATQSPLLIDNLNIEDIVVINRTGRESVFSRLDAGSLKEWLDSYTISELWEKNVLGGRPSK
jgi:predicted ATPase